ncbi:MAG: RIP metalloprotease RseP [Deltaproteobacteria bacterium]|nr:RIP metalloprotease RseP [Deltaproteobacteria bacterium]
MIYVVSTIIVLGILVFVHELGHFLAAKALGVRVEKFSLGFPPKMMGKKIGDTEYILSWIPLGGYVRMFGENPNEENGIPPEEQQRSFTHKPPWARFLIVLAGPVFNFIFAILVFCFVFAFQGIPHLSTYIGEVSKDMPAIEAGIMAEDQILAINGQPVKYWEDVSAAIKAGKGRDVEVTLQRKDRTITVLVAPKRVTVENVFGEKSQTPQIGIVARGDMVIESINPAAALYYGVIRTWDVTKLTLLSVVKLIERKIPLKTVGGPIFIAQIAGQQAKAGVLNLIIMMAVLSVNLGIINLFPIPILDGGSLVFFIMEMIFRRPLSLRTRELAQQAGIILLVLLMVVIFYNDLDRIFGLSRIFSR